MSGAEHPTDLLSAYLDGDLTEAERAAVADHLAGCPDCTDELELVGELRDLMRRLPEVEPPVGFFDDVLRIGPGGLATVRRRRLLGLANLLAAGALWLAVLGVVDVHRVRVVPALGDLAGAHAALVPVLAAGPPVTLAPEDAEAYDVPERLAGSYRLVGFRAGGEHPQAVYSNGDRTLSLFLVDGRLDEDRLPEGAERVTVNGRAAWALAAPRGMTAVLVPKGDTTAVLLGDAPAAAASAVADGDGGAGPSIGDRVSAAARALLETFGLRG